MKLLCNDCIVKSAIQIILNWMNRGLQEKPPCSPPTYHHDSTVTAVESFRFLGTTISQDLKWDNHIDSIGKKDQQRLYFLRQLRKFNLPQELLKQFYSTIIESVLCTSITGWFSSATKSDHKRLWRVVRTAERIIGTTLPTLHSPTVSSLSQSIAWTLDYNYGTHTIYTVIYITHILSLHNCNSIAHNIPVHTKLSIVIYLYIQLSICILHIVIPYLLVIFNSSFYYLCFLFCHCHSVVLR